MNRLIILILLLGFGTISLSAQGSVDPLEQLCKKKKLGRNDPKKDDIGDQDGDPCSNNKVTFQLTDPNCAGQSNGGVITLVSGLQIPVAYHWSNGATTPDLAGVPAGNYHLVVVDGDGCTLQASVVLQDPAPIAINIEVSNTSGGVATDGAASATATGGNGGYTYAWSSGATSANTGNTLPSGPHTVTVTDGQGCTQTATATIGENTGNGTPTLSADAGLSRSTCVGGQVILGGVQVATGGISPYTYNWGGPFAISNTTTANPTVVLGATGSHTFSVTVTDNNGNSHVGSFTITFNNSPVVALNAANNEVCSQDGPVELTGFPAGGTYVGAGVSGAIFNPIIAGPGLHTLTYQFTNPAGCSGEDTTTILVHPIVLPDWTPPPGPIYSCALPISLADQISGTLGGVFTGTLIGPDEFLDPALSLGPGDYPITYTVGSGSCTADQTVMISIEELQLVSVSPISVGTCDFPIQLTTMLTPGPVRGGVFSGGPYINDRNEIDPSGLPPGLYPIYYTYGIGSCRQVLESFFEITPNPLSAGFLMVQEQNVLILDHQSTGAGTFLYDFGDGAFSDDPNPVHAYSLPGVYEVCQTVANACRIITECQTIVVEPQPGALALQLRVFLGANFDPGTNLLSDALRQQNFLPAFEPYSEMGYIHKFGGGLEQINPGLLTLTGPDAPVDYVLVELRFKLEPTVKVASRTGLLLRDGRIIDTNGGILQFPGLVPDDYFVVVLHRNHLGVMTQDPIPLTQVPQQLDFSDPATPTFGQDAQWLSGGKMCLWPGDADFNGQVIYSGSGTDVNPISTAVFLNLANGTFSPSFPLPGYHPEDLNMDGQVIYSGSGTDVNRISTAVFLNPANGGFSPSFPLQSQVPPEQDNGAGTNL